MDSEFKTTFIPKRKLTSSRGNVKKGMSMSGGNSFLSLIAILLFVTAIVSAVGVYLYKARVSSVVKDRIASINRAEKAFEPTVILNLKKLDIRLKAATELLENHVALSDFFNSLGESTLPEVAFSEFTFDGKEGTQVSMSGEANGYLPIAQQSDLFEKNLYIKNPIFSDFELNEETGNITFNVEFTLDPQLIKYGRTIKNNAVDGVLIDEQKVLLRDKQQKLPSGKQVDFTSVMNNTQ